MNALHILALILTIPAALVFFVGGAALSLYDYSD
jgi:hypothetical protein